MPEQTFLSAIGDALREEMSRDGTVYVFGEDVALGGPFGVTKGLAENFGVSRVVNTPISEATVMGLAIGAATAGLRPVVEIMFIDFITLALDQLVNHAAKLHYMSGGQLNAPFPKPGSMVDARARIENRHAVQSSRCQGIAQVRYPRR
jgi:pyruvate dehydrogenase E1 component beta subunit